MTRIVILIAAALSIVRAQGLPPGLAGTIRKDFGVDQPGGNLCFQTEGVPFEKNIHTQWLDLNPTRPAALFVEGLLPCLSGNDNGERRIYARFGEHWRKIFDGVGHNLELAQTTTGGWRDVVLWQHDNAFRSVRKLCRFNGARYRPAACHVVTFQDGITLQKFDPSKYRPCAKDESAMRPN